MTTKIALSEFHIWLREKRACSEAREWLGDRTAAEAWDQCERADWLLWWAAKAHIDRKVVVRVACQCARRALRFVPAGELRPLRAIETAEAWTRGEASIADVRAAANAAYAADAANAANAAAYAAAYAANDAVNAANAANAVNAVYAAADAAYAANDAANAANAAANAANDAVNAVYAAADAANAANDAAYAARHQEHLAMCAIVRGMIPFEAVWHE